MREKYEGPQRLRNTVLITPIASYARKCGRLQRYARQFLFFVFYTVRWPKGLLQNDWLKFANFRYFAVKPVLA